MIEDRKSLSYKFLFSNAYIDILTTNHCYSLTLFQNFLFFILKSRSFVHEKWDIVLPPIDTLSTLIVIFILLL